MLSRYGLSWAPNASRLILWASSASRRTELGLCLLTNLDPHPNMVVALWMWSVESPPRRGRSFGVRVARHWNGASILGGVLGCPVSDSTHSFFLPFPHLPLTSTKSSKTVSDHISCHQQPNRSPDRLSTKATRKSSNWFCLRPSGRTAPLEVLST